MQVIKSVVVKWIWGVILQFSTLSCQTMQEQQAIAIEKVLNIDSIPSGSGVAVINDLIYLVGDDSPWLFQLSGSFEEVNRYLLVEGFQEEGRIPKLIKPDFECLAEFRRGNDHYLLTFGSGSKSPERDILVKINIKTPGKPEVYALTAFYNYLLEKTGMGRVDLNMEAALVLEDQLYLFNRGTNSIFVMSLPHFLAYLERGQEDLLPKFQHYPFTLPETDSVSAGFSGACALPDKRKILFTATLEATTDWIADGEIMGSYLGVLDVGRLAEGEVEVVALVKDQNGQVLKDKLESVAVLEEKADGAFTVLTVADNDDGTSKLLQLRIEKGFFISE